MAKVLEAAGAAIDAAKSNPLALVALIVILLAWVIIAFRVRRNSKLLANLSQLPEKDRLKALELEMGHVPLKAGLSPQQWLKYRVQQYYFFGFGLLCLFIIILVAIAKYSPGPALKTGASVTLRTDDAASPNPDVKPVVDSVSSVPTAEKSVSMAQKNVREAADRTMPPKAAPRMRVAVDTKWGARQMGEDNIPPERQLAYAAEIEGDTQHIGYRLGYLDLFKRGGPIRGYNPMGVTFKWRFPEVAVNIVNNTNSTMVLSQAVLSVLASSVDEDPLLVVERDSVNELIIHNEGWGDITGGTVELAIQEPDSGQEVALFAPAKKTVPLPAFTDTARIALLPLLPQRLRDFGGVSVRGEIVYNSARGRGSVAFETQVSLQVRAGAGIPASHTYKAFFTAGKAPARIPIDIAQRIAPGDADRFYIVLGADKTCHNRIRVDFQTAGGETVAGSPFLLDLFVPRSASAEDRR